MQIYVQYLALRIYAIAIGQAHNLKRVHSAYYLVACRVSAAFGTATIPAVYLAAVEPFGLVAGVSAAAIMTVTPLHVLNSKFATVDIAATFCSHLRSRWYCEWMVCGFHITLQQDVVAV